MLLSQLRGSLIFTLTLCGILGIGAALVAIPAQTTIQEETPEAERGRGFRVAEQLDQHRLKSSLSAGGHPREQFWLKTCVVASCRARLIRGITREAMATLLTFAVT